MTSFALISEGLTDQVVLERMIEIMCADVFEDEVAVNPLQPLRDATDASSSPHGGWELVLEFCKQRAADSLSTNDYVVIHLDTDQGDHPNFGLQLTSDGIDRAHEDLVADVTSIISSRVGVNIWQKYASRFLLAISIHSMESWLLLSIFDSHEPKNSLRRLNRRLTQAGCRPVTKDIQSYQRISKCIKKRNLAKQRCGSTSLGIFLRQLSRIGVINETRRND